jgi:hypothetical protein
MTRFYYTYKSIDFQAIWDIKFLIPDIHKQLFKKGTIIKKVS